MNKKDQWYYHYNHIEKQFEFYHYVANATEDEFYYDMKVTANDIHIKPPFCEIDFNEDDFHIMNYTSPMSEAYSGAFESIFGGIFV